MKLLIIKNNISLPIQDDIDRAFAYLKERIGIDFDITYKQTNIPVSYKFFITGTDGVKYYGTDGTKDKIRPLIDGQYDSVLFFYEGNPIQPDGLITSWTFFKGISPTTEYQEFICSETKELGHILELDIEHELMHAICNRIKASGQWVDDQMDATKVNGKIIPYYKNGDFNAPDSNFSQTLNAIKPYLSLLNKTMYKYFKPNEIVGLKPELVLKLDQARELAGTPFKITSGFRTPEYNASIGGASKSAHTLGLGVDIACTDNAKRFKILSALIKVGFKRIGIYTSHIHVDCANTPDYPQEIIFISDKE